MVRTPVILLAPLAAFFTACDHQGDRPDLSDISIPEIHIERFDTAFFALDTNQIEKGLYRLNQEYPDFTADFVGNILGAGPMSDTSRLAFEAARQFLVSYLSIRDSLKTKYQQLDWLGKDLR